MTLAALFVNEGALGSGVLGHARVEDSLRTGLAGLPGVAPRFVRLPPAGAVRRAATAELPVLTGAGFDLGAARWHAAQSLAAGRVARRALAAAPADVVHVHSHTSGLAVGAMVGAPVVLSVDATVEGWESMAVWGPRPRWSLQPSLAAERRALARAAGVIAFTGWAAEDVRRAQPRARVVELHPGLDLERFRPGARPDADVRRVLFVGGRFLEKGGGDLLAALAPRLSRDVELDVVTAAAVPAGPGVRIHRIAGDDAALLELYRAADLVCLPSLGDAAPWVVLEAMACAVPVVATTVGGIPDLLGRGEAGLLVPPGDREALRHVLDALLDDADERARLGAAGRARCEANYDCRRQGAALATLLQEWA